MMNWLAMLTVSLLVVAGLVSSDGAEGPGGAVEATAPVPTPVPHVVGDGAQRPISC